MFKTLRRTTALALAVLYLASLQAAVYAQTKEDASARTSLWRVKSKTNTIYLLGSMHLLRKENHPLPPAMEKAFADAKKLVLEVDLEGQSAEAVQRLMTTKGTLPGDKTLPSTLDKQTYEAVRKKVDGLGVPVQMFDKLKPWLVSLMMTILKLQTLGFDGNYGVDLYFSRKAREAKKEVLALETLEYQLDRFDQMSAATQESLLRQTLKELDVVEKEFKRLVGAWVRGDSRALAEQLQESFNGYPEVYERLLTERNRNWVPKIEEYLRQDVNYLVVVGALHLVGKDSVVEMLRAKGYTVEQP